MRHNIQYKHLRVAFGAAFIFKYSIRIQAKKKFAILNFEFDRIWPNTKRRSFYYDNTAAPL